MNSIDKLKILLKEEGMSGQDLAEILGIRYSSYRTMTGKSAKSVPKWANALVLGYKLGRDPDLVCTECEVRTNGYGKELEYCFECATKKRKNEKNI